MRPTPGWPRRVWSRSPTSPRAVNAANDLVSRAESIRKFEIVPEPFTEENGLLTASMKARRQAVIDHFGELIDTRIYAPKGR